MCNEIWNWRLKIVKKSWTGSYLTCDCLQLWSTDTPWIRRGPVSNTCRCQTTTATQNIWFHWILWFYQNIIGVGVSVSVCVVSGVKCPYPCFIGLHHKSGLHYNFPRICFFQRVRLWYLVCLLWTWLLYLMYIFVHLHLTDMIEIFLFYSSWSGSLQSIWYLENWWYRQQFLNTAFSDKIC